MKPVAAWFLLDSKLNFYRDLKAATQPLRERVEANIPLLDPQLTFDIYRALLRRFNGFYAPFEATSTSAAGENFTLYHSRAYKPAWLEQDLYALGDDDRHLATLP